MLNLKATKIKKKENCAEIEQITVATIFNVLKSGKGITLEDVKTWVNTSTLFIIYIFRGHICSGHVMCTIG